MRHIRQNVNNDYIQTAGVCAVTRYSLYLSARWRMFLVQGKNRAKKAQELGKSTSWYTGTEYTCVRDEEE